MKSNLKHWKRCFIKGFVILLLLVFCLGSFELNAQRKLSVFDAEYYNEIISDKHLNNYNSFIYEEIGSMYNAFYSRFLDTNNIKELTVTKVDSEFPFKIYGINGLVERTTYRYKNGFLIHKLKENFSKNESDSFFTVDTTINNLINYSKNKLTISVKQSLQNINTTFHFNKRKFLLTTIYAVSDKYSWVNKFNYSKNGRVKQKISEEYSHANTFQNPIGNNYTEFTKVIYSTSPNIYISKVKEIKILLNNEYPYEDGSYYKNRIEPDAYIRKSDTLILKIPEHVLFATATEYNSKVFLDTLNTTVYCFFNTNENKYALIKDLKTGKYLLKIKNFKGSRFLKEEWIYFIENSQNKSLYFMTQYYNIQNGMDMIDDYQSTSDFSENIRMYKNGIKKRNDLPRGKYEAAPYTHNLR